VEQTVGLLLSPTHQQGYTWESIRSYLRGCAQFGQGKAELYGALGPNNAPRLVEADLRELERWVNQLYP
jgi:hypothetical protein